MTLLLFLHHEHLQQKEYNVACDDDIPEKHTRVCNSSLFVQAVLLQINRSITVALY